MVHILYCIFALIYMVIKYFVELFRGMIGAVTAYEHTYGKIKFDGSDDDE